MQCIIVLSIKKYDFLNDEKQHVEKHMPCMDGMCLSTRFLGSKDNDVFNAETVDLRNKLEMLRDIPEH